MSYIARQKKSSTFDPRFLIAGAMLLVTVLMLYFGIKFMFRGTKEGPKDQLAPAETADTKTTDTPTADAKPAVRTSKELAAEEALKQLQADVYSRDAQINGTSGYNVRGAAQLRITFSDYQMTMAASLPALDSTQEQYEAWILQPGIADYFSVGTFFPRADGWYGLTFKNNRAHVPADPQTYNRILITREPLEDDKIPSNIRVAEGFFEL